MRRALTTYNVDNTELIHFQVDVMNNQADNHLNNQVCN